MAKAPMKKAAKGKVPAHLAKHTFGKKTAAKAATKVVAKAKKPSEFDGHEHLKTSKHFSSGAPAPRDPGASTKAPKKNDGLAAMADRMGKSMIGS